MTYFKKILLYILPLLFSDCSLSTRNWEKKYSSTTNPKIVQDKKTTLVLLSLMTKRSKCSSNWYKQCKINGCLSPEVTTFTHLQIEKIITPPKWEEQKMAINFKTSKSIHIHQSYLQLMILMYQSCSQSALQKLTSECLHTISGLPEISQHTETPRWRQ